MPADHYTKRLRAASSANAGVVEVPEPAWTLFGLAAVGLALLMRRRSQPHIWTSTALRRELVTKT